MRKEKCCSVNREPELLGLFRYLNKQLELSFNARLENYGLTSQQGRVIFFINYHTNILKEIVKQSDLEHHFRLSKSTISGLVKRLTNNGFIEKGDSNQNYAINLTEKGEKTISSFKKANEETRDILLRGFSEDKKEEMKQSLRQMIDNLEGSKQNVE
ncbi:MAG TPA: MarR family transcriptional regulator [Bacilli bacterium]|nr:MarR family transcriptional regulator [Bacilli bacterium]HPS19119.1 MarR family transcriptional regulator [Bacilli bacterium]